MALKSTYTAEEKGAEIEQTLDALDSVCDRLKVLYEQYFMGIQKQPPSHLHNTFERELRELQQQQIRNTALRYRLASLQQKHGAYNTYWKRTLREIEGGRYHRNLSKLRARAAKTGEEIPEEILAKMPRRMREAIAHDRELALDRAAREGRLPAEARAALAADASTEERKRLRRDSSPALGVDAATEERKRLRRESSPARVVSAPPLADLEAPVASPASGAAAPAPAAAMRPRGQRHLLDDMFGDDDIDQALSALADEAAVQIERRRPTEPPPLRPVAAAPAITGIPRVAPPPDASRPTPNVVPAVSARPARPAAPPRAEAAGIPGMSEPETRALYAKYVKARSLVGDATEPMSYERMVKTLSSQAPKILRDHHSTGVEFNVVVRDNKVILKAKPK